MPRWLAPALLLALAALLPACADQFAPTPTPTTFPDLLVNGVVATFDTPEGEFKVFATNESAIEALFRVQSGDSSATIPSGVLVPDSGAGEHNAPWSWHLHRQTVELVETASVLCNGTVTQVEEDLENWLQNIRRFCPSNAELVGITDYR
jgi:hypothetical protein